MVHLAMDSKVVDWPIDIPLVNLSAHESECQCTVIGSDIAVQVICQWAVINLCTTGDLPCDTGRTTEPFEQHKPIY